LLGGNLVDFERFILEFGLSEEKFVFVGSVNYLDLNKFWRRGTASIVMYLPTFINNRLCAPNRLYISVKMGLPVIVNRDNPVLSSFVQDYQCGFYIDDINSESDFESLLNINEQRFLESYHQLREEQIAGFISIYDECIKRNRV